jgi:hypothetical protein
VFSYVYDLVGNFRAYCRIVPTILPTHSARVGEGRPKIAPQAC